jgi:hypothetical protein
MLCIHNNTFQDQYTLGHNLTNSLTCMAISYSNIISSHVTRKSVYNSLCILACSVTGSHVNVIKMVCRSSKVSHSTVCNAEPCTKWQVQWKLRIWGTCEHRCARHHAVCWWHSAHDGHTQWELTVACYIISHFLWNCIWSYKLKRGYYMPKIPILLSLFLVFMLRCEICKFQGFVEIYCHHLQQDWIWFR